MIPILKYGSAIALIAHLACAGTFASPQRTREPLRGLGVPDESIRSILLVYLGRNINKAKATELEAELRKTPSKIDDRLTLIGYYSWNSQNEADRLRLRTHVVWVIEQHPEHPASAESSLRDLPDDPEGNTLILDIWTRNLESRGNELEVLKNAEKFFFAKEPATAERIINDLSAKEPYNRQWPTELSKLYSMFGIPGFASNDPEEKALEAYNRVLDLIKDVSARQSLAGEMADTAFKSGELAASARLSKIHLRSTDRSAVQRANTLLGRIALRSGDLPAAKQRLLDSSDSEAERYISVFGPSMLLAKELLQKGERDVVLQYLQNCLSLWPRGEETLRIWMGDIKNGKIPDFGGLAK